MIYVASPYSDPDPTVREIRFRFAEAFIASRLEIGAPAFSPVVYCHRMAATYQLPNDVDYWADVNRQFFAACSSVVLLALAGWSRSRGVAAELNWRRDRNLPLEIWSPRGASWVDGFKRRPVGDPIDLATGEDPQ